MMAKENNLHFYYTLFYRTPYFTLLAFLTLALIKFIHIWHKSPVKPVGQKQTKPLCATIKHEPPLKQTLFWHTVICWAAFGDVINLVDVIVVVEVVVVVIGVVVVAILNNRFSQTDSYLAYKWIYKKNLIVHKFS